MMLMCFHFFFSLILIKSDLVGWYRFVIVLGNIINRVCGTREAQEN